MSLIRFAPAAGVAVLLLVAPACMAWESFALETKAMEPHDVTTEQVIYKGHKAVKLVPMGTAAEELIAPKNIEGGGIAVLRGTNFRNGTIELEVAGKPRPGASADARGFVGVAFRVAADPSQYECFYVRPTNGRSEDQLRRNHSAQYISMPKYDWSTLRKETPGQYESYVDLIPGEWIKLKIEVNDLKARLYVNDAPQPVLVVNELKHGNTDGSVALWIGLQSEAYFSNLRINSPKK